MLITLVEDITLRDGTCIEDVILTDSNYDPFVVLSYERAKELIEKYLPYGKWTDVTVKTAEVRLLSGEQWFALETHGLLAGHDIEEIKTVSVCMRMMVTTPDLKW